MKVGSYLISFVDPFIDSGQARRIRGLFLGVYREMRNSPDFERLGSVLNYMYRDIFLNRQSAGHLYEYIPETKKERLRVILFLHGSMGNFKGYLWKWKSFADRYGFAVVAPSFGAGSWNLKGGTEAIEAARQYCLKHPRLDGEEVYLAGLSNGGRGVSRAAEVNPDGYRGLIFISAIMEEEILLGKDFMEEWKGRRMLILHGEADQRIDPTSVRIAGQIMKKAGINVEAKYYPKEDHFLMFSSWDVISNDIADWIAGSGESTL